MAKTWFNGICELKYRSGRITWVSFLIGCTKHRQILKASAEVIPDKQGRFIIPQNLKEHANITGATIIIGVSNRIEIWDQTAWQEFFSKKSQSFEETAEHLFDL